MEIIVTEEAIRLRVAELGQEIRRDYEGLDTTAVTLMNGGLFFAADLIRACRLPLWCDSLCVSSYIGQTSTGQLKFRSELKFPVKDRHILLLDEVFDSGVTVSCLRRYLFERGALSVRAAVAVVKDVKRPSSVQLPEYAGFHLPDRFLVGYGMDYNEAYRELPCIGVLD